MCPAVRRSCFTTAATSPAQRKSHCRVRFANPGGESSTRINDKKWSDRRGGANENRRMKARDLCDFTLLAALWGASFLFTRIAVPAFGPLAIADLRTVIAALVLLSLLLWRGGAAELAPNA